MQSESSIWKVRTPFDCASAARLHVLLELYPPTTIIRSMLPSSSATQERQDAVHALQRVSKLRNRFSASSAPSRTAKLFLNSAASASDSPASIVVWFAIPTRSRSVAKSNPG